VLAGRVAARGAVRHGEMMASPVAPHKGRRNHRRRDAFEAIPQKRQSGVKAGVREIATGSPL